MSKPFSKMTIDGREVSKITIDGREVSKIVDYNTGDVLYEGIKYPPATPGWDWHGKSYSVSSVGGRWFARHPSGMGTVMSMNDGTDRNILVLDAKYRTQKAYYSDKNTNLNSIGDQLCICNLEGIMFVTDFTELPYSGCSDTTLNTTRASVCNIDTNNSRYNTTKLVTFDSTKAQAASYCRSITVNGTGCDLPNLNVLGRIFCEMIMLDSLDPTVSSYPNYALSSWFLVDSGNGYCWSSSWCGKIVAGIYFAEVLGKFCKVRMQSQDGIKAVAPILEL